MTYVEDFETGNIEDTDEILSFSFDIERLIDTFDQPAEHTRIDLIEQKRGRSSPIQNLSGSQTYRFRQGTNGVDHLILVLTFVHVFVTDLDDDEREREGRRNAWKATILYLDARFE